MYNVGFPLPIINPKKKQTIKKIKELGGNNPDLYRYMARRGRINGNITSQKDLKIALDAIDTDISDINTELDEKQTKVRDIRTDNTLTPVLTLPDIGRLIVLTNSGVVNVVIPASTTVDFPIGTQIDFLAQGTGGYSFSAAGGVTLGSKASYTMMSARYVGASVIKISQDSRVLLGDLLP